MSEMTTTQDAGGEAMNELPPLPEPAYRPTNLGQPVTLWFTEEQMREYGRAAFDLGREDADWRSATGYATPAEYRADRDKGLNAALAETKQEPCWCDENNIGVPGETCGDCPRDYAAPIPQVTKPFIKVPTGLTDEQLEELARHPGGVVFVEQPEPALVAALKKANAQAEHFEREWYLRGDVLEDVVAAAQRVVKDFDTGYISATPFGESAIETLRKALP
jgi:hypothetical protein